MASSEVLGTLIISITFCFVSFKVFSLPSYENIPVPSGGAHSFAFDSLGRGPYSSISDGRVLRYRRLKKRFVDFAFTSPDRTTRCDGVTTLDMLTTCGRPLSLVFNHLTQHLYIADAALGLFVVGPFGGQATQLATTAAGVPFRFTVGLDVDQVCGDVYFTDASSTGGIDEVLKILTNKDATGRLLKYDPKSKKVSVLLSEISGAAGVAISEDRNFLLITEFIGARILKYWLRGSQANTVEVIMNVTGIPDNIRRTKSGEFFVAVTSLKGDLLGVKIDGYGTILETINFSPQFEAQTIAEVFEHNDSIYLGSLMGANLGVYRR